MKLFTTILGVAFIGTSVFSQIESDTSKVRADSVIVINLNADDLDNDQNQDVSGLLQSSRDVFANIAGYNFSNARYKMRGYQSEHYTVMMNGIPMNSAENGWAIWSFWGGLNDVTRYPQTGTGISTNDANFGGIGGYSNIDLRASRFRAGSRLSYAATNRTYRNRVMLTHATGLMKNGWAVAASLSTRWSKEGYVEGTSYSAMSYFLSIEKKINDKHTVGLAGFGAPTVQGRSGLAVQEAYDLTGNNYYNPYWGYQTMPDGEVVKRNSRVRNNHIPYAFLTHYFTLDKQKSIKTSIYGSYGRSGSTGLNWNDAKDPRPDYYRYLPSYYSLDDPIRADQMTAAWSSNDASVTQINWDHLYNSNTKNIYYLENANGVDGNNLEFLRSKYIVQDYRQDPVRFGLNSVMTIQPSSGYNMNFGLNVDRYTSHNFITVDDLLGGEYWLDVNQFAEETYESPLASQNNLDTPNRIAKVGDKIGYNYDMHVNTETAFGQVEKKTSKVDWYAALKLSHTQFYRDGLWKNGMFEDESFGKSEIQNYINYGVKGGAVYKVTGRHFVTANGQYETKAPYSRNAYISPRTRNTLVKGLGSMEIMSGDLNYHVRYPNFRARATAYYTAVNNQTWSRTFYNDEFRNFVNYTLTGVDQTFAGTEVGAEGKINDTWIISGAFAHGQFLYNSRPEATITVNNDAELLADGRTVYLKNYHVGGMPETAASLGLKYNSPKYWYVGFSFNWFTNIYLSPNPARRTEEAVTKYIETDPQWDAILEPTVVHNLEQNKFFDNNYTLDAYAGMSFKIKEKFLRINLNANNVLNNKNFLTGGYEQLRFDSNNVGKFPPKYGYMYGTTFFAMVSFLF